MVFKKGAKGAVVVTVVLRLQLIIASMFLPKYSPGLLQVNFM